MGLDMYLFGEDHADYSKRFEDGHAGKITLAHTTYQLGYWRKHPNLQGWMEALYRSKGGEGGFNCDSVRVSFQDLRNLEDAVNTNGLPHTEGFFFGDSSPEDKADDLAFIAKAREAIAMDMEIYYYSWW